MQSAQLPLYLYQTQAEWDQSKNRIYLRGSAEIHTHILLFTVAEVVVLIAGQQLSRYHRIEYGFVCFCFICLVLLSLLTAIEEKNAPVNI